MRVFLTKLLLLVPLAWSCWVLVVNGPYMRNPGIPNTHSFDAAWGKGAKQLIENPAGPVSLTQAECTDLVHFGIHYTIEHTEARQWHVLTAALLLIVSAVALLKGKVRSGEPKNAT